MQDFINVQNLNFGYGSKTKPAFLQIESLSIPENKITGILGPNGSGKSTFLKVLCGIAKPWSGEILLSEENILLMENKERAKKIAFVPQTRNIPDITVKNLVLHGRFPYTKSFFSQGYTKHDEEIAMDAMKKLGLLEIADRNVKTLSGGQRQKVYIALGLTQETPILVLDEPLSFLDIRQQLELVELLKSMNKTIILVIHDISLALDFSDNIILFQEGKIAATGTPETILSSGMIEKVFEVKISRQEKIEFGL